VHARFTEDRDDFEGDRGVMIEVSAILALSSSGVVISYALFVYVPLKRRSGGVGRFGKKAKG
jgi:hypothetical protein